MGYDAMTVGDKDLGLGLEVLKEREAEADFPFLSANLVYADSRELVFAPYTVVTVGGRKVGILGLSGSQESVPRDVGDGVVLDLLAPVQVAQQYVDELSGNTDIIVVLSLMGLDSDRALAQLVGGIDLIVGGASQNILGEPRLIPNTTTVVVQAGARGEWVGRVELDIDSSGVVRGATGSTPRLDDTFADDAEMLALVEKAKQEASGAQ